MVITAATTMIDIKIGIFPAIALATAIAGGRTISPIEGIDCSLMPHGAAKMFALGSFR
jgi:hypothetical protein